MYADGHAVGLAPPHRHHRHRAVRDVLVPTAKRCRRPSLAVALPHIRRRPGGYAYETYCDGKTPTVAVGLPIRRRYLVVIDDIWDTSELGLKSLPLRENTILKAWEVEDQDEKESNEDQSEEGIQEDLIKMRNEEHWMEKQINEDQAKKENDKELGMEGINKDKSEKASNENDTKIISKEYQSKKESKEDEYGKEWKHNFEQGSKEDRSERKIYEDQIEVNINEYESKKVRKKDLAEKQSSDNDDKEEKEKDHAKKERTEDHAKKQSNEVQAKERSKEDHAKKEYKEYQDKEVIIDDRAEEENKEYHVKKKCKEDQGEAVGKESQAVQRIQEETIKYGSHEDWTELKTNIDQTDVSTNDDEAELIENKEDEAGKGSQEERHEVLDQDQDQVEKQNEDKLLTFLDDWEFKSWSISGYKKKDWEIVKDAFPDDRCGSRIIVTTRISSIARFCCSSTTSGGLVHEVKPLNDVDSERLFLTKAFGSENGGPPPESRQACDKILSICEGVPMFITGMADIMKKKMEQSSSACDLVEQVPQLVGQFVEELSYCYNDLFYGLELLPLSMSTALVVQQQQKGCMIDKERLIRAWVREGLIYSDDWGDCEEKAERCFSELVDRNIIQLQGTTFPGMTTETCHCQVDPFVLQFLVSKSGKVNFVTTCSNMLSQQAGAAGKKQSRMVLSSHHSDPEMLNLSSTLSLTISGEAPPVCLDKVVMLGSLVVLDLEGWNKLRDEDLLRVCDMGKALPLKYLSVRNSRSITKLPMQIQVLLHLRELDIGGCTRIRELPLQVCRLEKLEALDLRNTRVRQLVPEQIAGLKGLRRLLLDDQLDGVPWTEQQQQQLPEGIRHIAELRTLATVDLSRCSARFVAEALGGLTSLRVLAITWSRHQCSNGAYRDALWKSIGSWKRLKSLTIHCRLGCSMDFLAELPSQYSQLQLPRELEMLKVTAAGRFPVTPEWIRGLSRLAFLQITVCSLALARPGGMEILGSLPMLECLVLGLEFLPRQGALIQGGGFRRLLRLSIHCRVPWLDFKQGAMPRLTHLEITMSRVPAPACRESVPSGIGNLMSLEQVAVRYHAWYLNSCCVRATVDAMRKQVAQLHYMVNLVINGIQDDVQAILEAGEEERSRATQVQTISKQIGRAGAGAS